MIFIELQQTNRRVETMANSQPKKITLFVALKPLGIGKDMQYSGNFETDSNKLIYYNMYVAYISFI